MTSEPSGTAMWVSDDNQALLTDLYQLTMLQAYWREEMREEAVFSLFFRKLPTRRNYMLACGLEDVLHYLETLRFPREGLDYLATLGLFRDEFLRWLESVRFTGEVYAVPEGTPVFPDVPLLEVVAPIAEAQLIETLLMNRIHLQTVLASKAARTVEAAQGRRVVDFGLRRMHGADAGLKSARAFHIAGVAATSNVLAGRVYGIPVAGTMAHSYIQAHESEMEAFRAFVRLYPQTVLLVDTYDTLQGVEKVIRLARELGDEFRVRAIRLDSGDMAALAIQARRMLDEAGFARVEIFASGGLDEYGVAELVGKGAPIDGFGVGTRMGVSQDAPSLDLVYKLVAYAGQGRLKTSPDKATLPGRKQVFRVEEGEGDERRAARDILAREGEEQPGRPLLCPVMRGGERLPAGEDTLEAARERARAEIAKLPKRIRSLDSADPPYPVEISPGLRTLQAEVRRGVVA